MISISLNGLLLVSRHYFFVFSFVFLLMTYFLKHTSILCLTVHSYLFRFLLSFVFS